MMSNYIKFNFIMLIFITICFGNDDTPGCKDTTACNYYNANVTEDDGS